MSSNNIDVDFIPPYDEPEDSLQEIIDTFMAYNHDALVIVALVSLAFEQVLQVTDVSEADSSRILFVGSKEECVAFAPDCPEARILPTRTLLRLSGALNQDSCVAFCKALIQIIKEDSDEQFQLISEYNLGEGISPDVFPAYGEGLWSAELGNLYQNLFNKICPNKAPSHYFNRLVSLLVEGSAYVVFASQSFYPDRYEGEHGLFHVGMDPHNIYEYWNEKIWAMETFNPRFVGLGPRPTLMCRDLDQWFSNPEGYETILCQVPYNRYLVYPVIEKLLEAKFGKALLLVNAGFLSDFDPNTYNARGLLTSSGKISWVMSLPGVADDNYALICLEPKNCEQVTFVDGYSRYKLANYSNDNIEDNLDEFEDTCIEMIENPQVDSLSVQVSFGEVKSATTLNPAFFVNPLPEYEGEGEYDYIELGQVLGNGRHPSGVIGSTSGGRRPLLTSSGFPQNEFGKVRFNASITPDDSFEYKFMEGRRNVIYYSRESGKEQFAIVEQAESFAVDFSCLPLTVYSRSIDIHYLLHQLYRKEIYLQVPLEDKYEMDNFEKRFEKIVIPVPKGPDSLARQQQIYETAKKVYLSHNDDPLSYDIRQDLITLSDKVSDISLDCENCTISFLDYNHTIELESQHFAIYLFLLRPTADRKAIKDKSSLTDYKYELAKIYYALKSKANRYSETPQSTAFSKVFDSMDNILCQFSQKVSKINRQLKKELQPLTSQGSTYCIPSGPGVNRRIRIEAGKHIVVSRGFPANFLDKPMRTDEYYHETIHAMTERAKSKETNTHKEPPAVRSYRIFMQEREALNNQL